MYQLLQFNLHQCLQFIHQYLQFILHQCLQFIQHLHFVHQGLQFHLHLFSPWITYHFHPTMLNLTMMTLAFSQMHFLTVILNIFLLVMMTVLMILESYLSDNFLVFLSIYFSTSSQKFLVNKPFHSCK